MPPNTMRAVVFNGPYKIDLTQRSKTHRRRAEGDFYCTLWFRPAFLSWPSEMPHWFICGHEFVGEIVEKGDKVEGFDIGDKVVVPFCSACQECYYCVRGQASRCAKGELFDNSAPTNTIDGEQAEYVRVPLASTTLVKTPDGIPKELLVLMANIFPTGYFAAARFLKDLTPRDREDYTTIVIGCRPTVYAIDSVPERLTEAEAIGAIPISLDDSPVEKIKAATEGRGADVIMEIVGHADAFMLAFDLIRP
uniref:Uncharacterized protein n=1 Tax=Bionectria ochroleuca TaxID=29856 RepID=A0A8H7K4U8_BIOOC